MTTEMASEVNVEQHKRLEDTLWGRVAPWVMTSVSLLTLVGVALFLLDNLAWFKDHAFPPGVQRDPAFTLYAFHLHLAMVKRSVGLFTGFSLVFIGTAVALFSIEKMTRLEGTTPTWSARIVTASPGIVAMVLGSLVIMFVIASKDQFDAIPQPEDVASQAVPRLVHPPEPDNTQDRPSPYGK